jgi:hypothetical protein
MDTTLTPLLIFEHCDVLYAQLLQDEPYIVKLPRGMVNLKEIEEYVQNYIDLGFPSMEFTNDCIH